MKEVMEIIKKELDFERRMANINWPDEYEKGYRAGLNKALVLLKKRHLECNAKNTPEEIEKLKCCGNCLSMDIVEDIGGYLY